MVKRIFHLSNKFLSFNYIHICSLGIANRFTNQYGGVEGFTSVVIEATKDQTVPFTLLTMGGMSVSTKGSQQYLNDVYASQNDTC